MATQWIIVLPNGRKRMMYYAPDQDKKALIEQVLLSHWEEYCDANWLNDGDHGGRSPEERVKYFLDGCAYMLLRDNPEGTLSRYKDVVRECTEVPVSCCPASIQSYLYGGSHAPSDLTKDEFFQSMLAALEEKAARYGKKRIRPPRRAGRPSLTAFRRENVRTRDVRLNPIPWIRKTSLSASATPTA